MTQSIRSLAALAEGLGFNSQWSSCVSQPHVSPVPGDLIQANLGPPCSPGMFTSNKYTPSGKNVHPIEIMKSMLFTNCHVELDFPNEHKYYQEQTLKYACRSTIVICLVLIFSFFSVLHPLGPRIPMTWRKVIQSSSIVSASVSASTYQLWIKFCPDFPRSCNLQAETCKQKETITSFCSFGPRSLSHWNQDRLAYLHLCYLPVLKLLVTNSLFRTVEWLFNARQLPRHCCPMNLGYISHYTEDSNSIKWF